MTSLFGWLISFQLILSFSFQEQYRNYEAMTTIVYNNLPKKAIFARNAHSNSFIDFTCCITCQSHSTREFWSTVWCWREKAESQRCKPRPLKLLKCEKGLSWILIIELKLELRFPRRSCRFNVSHMASSCSRPQPELRHLIAIRPFFFSEIFVRVILYQGTKRKRD